MVLAANYEIRRHFSTVKRYFKNFLKKYSKKSKKALVRCQGLVYNHMQSLDFLIKSGFSLEVGK
jgi:hypothetical protein